MFSTERLQIAPWGQDLAQDFFELTQDEGFRLFPITDYRQENLEAARRWVSQNAVLFESRRLGKYAVLERTSDVILGMGGLTPWTFGGEELIDVTYRLRESAWGRGLGLELARGLVTFGFEQLELPQVTATITPDNGPSKKIAERLGFERDQRILLLGVETDLYRLLR